MTAPPSKSDSNAPSAPGTGADPLIGTVLAERYRILEPLAQGGMGIVYKAEQVQLGRIVAVKVLNVRTASLGDAGFNQRFFLEATAAAKLSHSNTIVIHDFGRAADGSYFLAMEHLEGLTLHRAIRQRGPVPPARGIHIGLQICASLAEAHGQGLVHRDLKPSNVFLTRRGADPDFVKVLDFGLVKVIGARDLGLTRSGIMMGSPRYMSPEQVKGLGVDGRSDIYSFGATMYHALAGRPPFMHDSEFDVMTAHVSETPPPILVVAPGSDVSRQFEAVVMRCLEKEPEARFQSMADLATALLECQAELGPNAIAKAAWMSTPSGGLPAAAYPGSGDETEPEKRERVITVDLSPRSGMSAVRAAAGGSARRRSPRSAERSRVVAAVVGITLGVAVVAFAVVSLRSWPTPSDAHASVPSTAGERVERRAPDAPEAHPVPALEKTVRLTSEPAGATVLRGGTDLGPTPMSLELPSGERWQIRIVEDGYVARDVTIDGRAEIVHVALTPRSEAERRADRTTRRGGSPVAATATGSDGPTEPAATPPDRSSGGAWPERAHTDNRDPWNP